MTHDPQMVAAVARAIEAADVSMVTPYEAFAEAALETSHHAELMKGLRSLATFDFGTRASMRKYAADVLAKVGGGHV